MARELAVDETSASRLRIDAEWEAGGDAINAEALATWGALPLDELRRAPDRRRRAARPPHGRPGGALAEERRPASAFFGETIDHYADHADDLAAILAAAAERRLPRTARGRRGAALAALAEVARRRGRAGRRWLREAAADFGRVRLARPCGVAVAFGTRSDGRGLRTPGHGAGSPRGRAGSRSRRGAARPAHTLDRARSPGS